MHPVEFFKWWLPPDPENGRPKRSKTRWKMTREEAAKYPGAEADESMREVRMLPDGPDEHVLTSGRRRE